MYCPSCGNQQPEEKKFCTACGTNLSLIASVLNPTNASLNPALLTEARAKYNKQFSSAIGNIASGIGLLVAAIFIYETMRLPFIPWVSMGLICGGFPSLGRGIGQLYFATQEWKAVQAVGLMPTSQTAPLLTPIPTSVVTAPLPPSSVTDHTTRHLG